MNNFLVIFAFLLTVIVTFQASAQVEVVNVAHSGVAPFESDWLRMRTMETRVFDLVNDERVKNGLSLLVWNEKAALAARYHSGNMASSGFLGHEDLFGKKPEHRVERFGLTDWRRLGENVAWVSGHEDPLSRVVSRWMNSPGHRLNILGSKFNESGLGMSVTKDGKFYFTQVFVTRR